MCISPLHRILWRIMSLYEMEDFEMKQLCKRGLAMLMVLVLLVALAMLLLKAQLNTKLMQISAVTVVHVLQAALLTLSPRLTASS